MSSKLIRPGDAASATVAAWTPVSIRTAPGGRTAEPGRPQNASGDVQREVDAQLKAAYTQGEAEGAQRASQLASQLAALQLEPVIAGLKQVIQELAGTRKRFRNEAEADTVKLAIAIARRVLYRELATDPEAILGVVMAAFQKLNARETHRLRVSPADAAVLQEHRSRLELPPAVEILGDATMGPGSAVFETSRGELDASVNTQLAEIEHGLADIIRRRSK